MVRFVLSLSLCVCLAVSIAACGEDPDGGPGEESDPDAASSSDGGSGEDQGTNSEVTTDAGDQVCCDCYQEGDACPPEAEALNCPGFMAWCDGQVPWAGMECRDGIWSEEVFITGFPQPETELCQEANGEASYCQENGECAEGTMCLEEDCCVPMSAQGDAYCQATIGECSACYYKENWGTCLPAFCD